VVDPLLGILFIIWDLDLDIATTYTTHSSGRYEAEDKSLKMSLKEKSESCSSYSYIVPRFSGSWSYLAVFLLFLSLSGFEGQGLPEEKSVTHNQREDLFSSTSKLEELVESELQIVDLLDTFADYALERAQTIKS
jgi:hypothetical protein